MEGIYRRYKPEVRCEPGYDNRCHWFIFSSNKLLVRVTGTEVSIPFLKDLAGAGIDPVRTQYLGVLDGAPCYSVEVSPKSVTPTGMAFKDLRSLYGALDEDIFLVAGKAIQIVDWDQTHQYCGRCGTRTEEIEGERAKKCPACGFRSYPRITPAVIVGVIRENKILLARYAMLSVNWRTVLAGFVEAGETLEECVEREVAEEVDIKVKNIRYFGSQPWPFPNSLMVGFTAEYESGEIRTDGTEIAEASWYDVNSLPEIPPRMSIARQIIDWFIKSFS